MSVERLTRLNDEELGRALHTLDLAWPTTPDVARHVLAGIEQDGSRHRRLSHGTVVLLVAASILVLAAATALAARFALDLGGIAIEPVPSVSLPASPVEPKVLGRPVSRAEAEQALGSPLSVPQGLGEPDRIWLWRDQTSFEPEHRGVVVAMAWRPHDGLPRIPGTPYGATLITFEGDDVVAVKRIDAPWEEIGRYRAVWIDAPHELDLLAGGRIRSFRVTGTVLIWQHGASAERLETALPQRAVLRIAFGSGT
jgi:hypothetical protein